MEVRNDNAFDGTGYIVGNGNHSNSALAVDSNGRAGVVVVSSLSGAPTLTTVVQTVAATLHAANDVVGGKITLADVVRSAAPYGTIQAVTVFDKAGNAGSYDVVFFSADPSATTITDDAALTVADADGAKIVGFAPVTTTSTFVDNGITCTTNYGLPFVLASGTSLYAALIARTAVTFASVSDITIRVSILQG